MESITTLRPGLLVSLKTSLQGNVTYDKLIIEPEHLDVDGAQKASWETKRVIADPVEHERAKETRSKASQLVRSVCARSAFGLLCPETKGEELAAAIAEARQLVEDFNRDAKLTRVAVYVITGRVASDDMEAVRAINSEVRELLDQMTQGVQKLDVEAIRDAASRAKQLGSMLSPDAEARVRIAIDTAREAARRIVKAGETAAEVIDAGAVRKITEMRTAFLDIDDQEAAPVSIEAPAPIQARALDMFPVEA